MNYLKGLTVLILFALVLDNLISAKPTTKWTFTTGGAVYSSPTYFNGNIYIGSDDGKLYSLDAETGAEKWEFKTGGIVRCRPAISNGALFFASDDGNLYSLDAGTGIQNWIFNIGNKIKRILPNISTSTGNYWDYMQSSPCVDSGIVYVGSGDSSLYALDAASGSLKWRAKTKGLVRSSPCVYNNDVYVGSWDGFIYSFNKNDGSAVWSFSTAGSEYKNVQPSPCVVDGILYCGSRNPTFYALDANTGKYIWGHGYNGSWVESSATVVNNSVYVGSSDLDVVYSFNAKTGAVIWACNVGGDTWSSPVYDNGTLYIGLASYWNNSMTSPAGGSILAIDASNGKINWKLNCGTSPYIGGVVSSPAVYNNVVFYGGLDGKVYAAFNSPTEVDEKQGNNSLPREYRLANYPNPFNPSTMINYQLPSNGNVSLKVYDLLGREVAELVEGYKPAGDYNIKFDLERPDNFRNRKSLSSGIYFCTLRTENVIRTRKMIALK
jgi:eukaryotic-like serine/threonine-protein kinase